MKKTLLIAGVAAFVGIASMAVSPVKAHAAKKAEDGWVGAKKCDGSCHDEWQIAWKETKHSKTFELLKPGERTDAKKKAAASIKEKLVKFGGRDQAFADKLDVATADFTKEPLCLRCHTTGFGQEGGYDPENPKDAYIADEPNKAAVGCEMCHSVLGGSKFRQTMKKSKGKFKLSEINTMAEGYNYPAKGGAGICNRCHEHENTPFQASVDAKYKFDYEARKDPAKMGVHKHPKMENEHDNGSPKKFTAEKWHIKDGKVVIDAPAKLE